MVVVLLALLAFAPVAWAEGVVSPSGPDTVRAPAGAMPDHGSLQSDAPAGPSMEPGAADVADPSSPRVKADSVRAPREAHPGDGRDKATWLGERRVSTSRDATPGVVRRLDREDLERAGDLATAIGRLPGVRVRRIGGLGGYAEVSLRGSPASQVEVYVDGVPLHGSAGAAVDLGSISVDGLERAEVRQATAADGAGAARIDLVSRRSWSAAGVSLKGGSFGELGGSVFVGTPGGMATAALWGERADNDYPFPWDRGTRYNTADDTIMRLTNNGYRGLGASAGVRLGESQELNMRWESSRKDVSSVNVLASDAHFDRTSWQAAWSGEWGGRLRMPVRAAMRRFESGWADRSGIDHRSDIEAREEAWDLTGEVGASWTGMSWWNPHARLRGRWESSERHSLGQNEVALTPTADRGTLEAGIGWSGAPESRTWGLHGTVLAGILRDTRDDTPSGGRIFEAPASDSQAWRFSFRLQGGAWIRPRALLEEAWISGSYRQRAPEFREILGDGGLALPNYGLQNEDAWLCEGGIRAAAWGIQAEIVPFYAFYRHAIENQRVGGSPLSRSENSLDYDHLGAETRLARAGHWASVDAALTMQRTWLHHGNPTFDGKEMSRVPRWKTDLDLTSREFHGLSASYSLEAQGETWASPRNDETSKRPVRALHGARLAWRRGGAEIAGSIRNISDEHYEDYEDYALSGRSFHVEAVFRLGRPRRSPATEDRQSQETDRHEEIP